MQLSAGIPRPTLVTFLLVISICHQMGADAAPPSPILENVFPVGGQAGTEVEIVLAGSGLTNVTSVQSVPGITSEQLDDGKFRLTIDASVPPGHYDLRALTAGGLSSPRAFVVSHRTEQLETGDSDSIETATSVPLDSVTNGRIEQPGDVDHFRFEAQRGQLVVVECFAKRIDSPLRSIIEIFDETGRRLAVSRGYFGIDPLIPFVVPHDGTFLVRVFDLIYSGSADHVYRLEIDTGPRVAFSVPSVLPLGKTSRVKLYGWNLNRPPSLARGEGSSPDRINSTAVEPSAATFGSNDFASIAAQREQRTAAAASAAETMPAAGAYDTLDVDITAPESPGHRESLRLRPSQLTVDGFAYHHPDCNHPIQIGLTDLPVVAAAWDNHSAATAQQIDSPCEVSGKLAAGDEIDWFSINALRGEVLWIEAFGERIDSPVDLDVSVLDADGNRILARFSDQQRNIGGTRFPSSHLDPGGRWLVGADGQYFIVVRNLTGGLADDARRVYRLSIQRETPDVHLVTVPRRDNPAALNVMRGGRLALDVVAFRNRGLTGTIRVSADDLPPGIECPDVWLGPGVERAPLVVTATDSADPLVASLDLASHAELTDPRPVRGSTVVRGGTPNGWSRLTQSIDFSVAGEAAVKITADGHQTRGHHLYGELKVRHSPGGILDVAVQVERRDATHQAPVELIGIGLPESIPNQTATIPANHDKGYISFQLPPNLPTGRYTIAIEGRTTVPISVNDKRETQAESVTFCSNPVTFDVEPAAFVVELDRYAPREIRRGEIAKVNYAARRINGFIGKIHTELYAAGEVIGLRGRGVTFVGQTETGVIQIVANENAPLGAQPFLRLYAVGVVEDEPVYHGSCFLPLEIVE